MLPLVRLYNEQIFLIVAPGAAKEQMLAWVAMRACQEKVRVIDGGNQFNVYRVAKTVRRQTHRVHEALQNISISRSFSCYQMAAALAKEKTEATPLFLLDFLFSFYDEDVRLEESQRLLKRSIQNLTRLSKTAPIVAGVRPQMYNPARAILLEEMKEIVTQLWEVEAPGLNQIQAPSLPWPQDTKG